MTDERCVLAIDLGSGGPKVAVVSENGTIVAHAREPIATIFVPGDGAEQDPHEWWQAVTKAVAPPYLNHRSIPKKSSPSVARGNGR